MILLLALLGAGLSGCTKQLASWSLNKAKQRSNEAKNVHEAPVFAPEKLTAVEAKIKEAQDAYDGGNFQSARDNARVAAQDAKDLLAETKAKRAANLMEEADKNVRVATDNQGDTIDTVVYKRILQTQDQAHKARDKEKHDKTIELCLRIRQDTDVLLNGLKLELDGKLRDARNQLLDVFIKRELGRDEAPQYVTEAETKITELEGLIAPDKRQYIQARRVYTEADAVIKGGITAARLSRSKKAITILEEKLIRARKEGAEKYHAEFLQQCDTNFALINKFFFASNYVSVLNLADVLGPNLDTLILQSRISAAQDLMNQVTSAIRSLDNDKVRTYLPGRVEKMDGLLAEADKQFGERLYDDVKKICANALEEKGLILQDYDNLTVGEIHTARGTLSAAESVLNRTDVIFDAQSPPSDDPERMAFEKTKQAHKAELKEIAKESEILVAMADARRQDKQFSAAIENARKVVRLANYVVHEIYHVLAHNNVMEITSIATKTAGDGGSQFAPDEMKKAQVVLEEARDMIRQQEKAGQPSPGGEFDPNAYKPAVAKTAEAFAAVEVVVQRIKHVTAGKIADARKAIEAAEANKASVYALGQVSTARQILQQADENLAREMLFEAAKNADDSKRIALESNKQATQTWAKEELQAAEAEIQKAKASNAPEYAPIRYKESTTRINAALEIFKSAGAMPGVEEAADAFKKSRDLAKEAGEAATQARMEPVTKANEAILTAQRLKAWDYDYNTILQAIINARVAMEAMDAGDFQRARDHAARAQQNAQRAATTAKNASFVDRVKADSRELADASDQGGIYFSLQDVARLTGRLEDIRKGYSAQKFETISAELDTYERDLTLLMKKTPQVFNQALEKEQTLYQSLAKAGAEDYAATTMREANLNLRHARVDFDAGRYETAYRDLRKGIEILDDLDSQRQERAFADRIHELLGELSEKMNSIRQLTNLSGPVADTVAMYRPITGKFGLEGVAYGKFRMDMDQMYAKMQTLEHPDSMGAEYEKAVECIRLARQASMAFNKFIILDRYDTETARNIIAEGFSLIGQSRTMKDELTRRFEEKGLQGGLAKFGPIGGR